MLDQTNNGAAGTTSHNSIRVILRVNPIFIDIPEVVQFTYQKLSELMDVKTLRELEEKRDFYLGLSEGLLKKMHKIVDGFEARFPSNIDVSTRRSHMAIYKKLSSATDIMHGARYVEHWPVELQQVLADLEEAYRLLIRP